MMTVASKPGARCACGQVYTAESWQRLATVQTLGAGDLGAYVVAWPEERAVEVRTCRACGRAMARLR